MNKARQRRENLQNRIREYRSTAIWEPPQVSEPPQTVELYVHGKGDNSINSVFVSATVPMAGLAKKLDEMQKNGFWVKQNGTATWVAPNSIGKVNIYPTPEQVEEPIELRTPPSKDSFGGLISGLLGGFFGH